VVSYHDPYVPHFQVGDDVFHRESIVLESVELTERELVAADCVVIVTDHRDLDYAHIVQHANLIVDTRNVTAGVTGDSKKVVRLGAPLPR
jgi:UDP-N-acetyl-D-glucosamine dehydrogenase